MLIGHVNKHRRRETAYLALLTWKNCNSNLVTHNREYFIFYLSAACCAGCWVWVVGFLGVEIKCARGSSLKNVSTFLRETDVSLILLDVFVAEFVGY